jgi:hypothetical protein
VLNEQHPKLKSAQIKAINKVSNVGLDGFANGIRTEK